MTFLLAEELGFESRQSEPKASALDALAPSRPACESWAGPPRASAPEGSVPGWKASRGRPGRRYHLSTRTATVSLRNTRCMGKSISSSKCARYSSQNDSLTISGQ